MRNGVCKVSSTPEACGAAVPVRSGRYPVRVRGSKVRFADNSGASPSLNIGAFSVRVHKSQIEHVISQRNSLSYLGGNHVTWKATAVLFCNPGLYTGAFQLSY